MDCYKTSFKSHYEQFLNDAGFIVSTTSSNNVKLDKETQKEMKDITYDINEALFNEFINAEDKNQPKFETINNNIKVLNVQDVEIIKKHKNIFMNKYNLQDVLNFNRFIKTDSFIDDKVKQFNRECFVIKSFDCVYNKIKIVNKIMNENKINHFTFDKFEDVKINDKDFDYVKKLFRLKIDKPETENDIKYFILSLYKNILGNDFFVRSQKKVKQGAKWVKEYIYEINKSITDIYVELTNNLDRSNVKPEFMQLFNIQENNIDFDDEDIDDEQEYIPEKSPLDD
jgi:hypothetical protein